MIGFHIGQRAFPNGRPARLGTVTEIESDGVGVSVDYGDEIVPEWADELRPVPELLPIHSHAELEELPAGAVILCPFPSGVAEKTPSGSYWWFTGNHVNFKTEAVPLPARLLWLPQWELS